jgi:hypothetical protein
MKVTKIMKNLKTRLSYSRSQKIYFNDNKQNMPLQV